MQIEILLFDGFDELDAIGPWEVLAGAAAARPDWRVTFVTLAGAREVRASRGALIGAGGALSERPDLLVVPGGGWLDRAATGAWAEAQRGELPAAIAVRHRADTTIASVCTGALLLAESGILAGRRATTNPLAYDELRRYDGVEVLEARVVEDGDIVTAGAPSCALDLGLALLARAAGPEVAAAAGRELQLPFPR
jgi:transcriptional regulator GlxA family with amidase domain